MLTPPAPQLGAHVEHTRANCPHYCGSRQPTARPADSRVQRQSDGCAMQAWPRRLPRCCRPAAVAAALPGGSRQGLRCGSLAGPRGLPSLAVARLFQAPPGQHSIARAAQGGRRSACRSGQVEPGERGDAMRPGDLSLASQMLAWLLKRVGESPEWTERGQLWQPRWRVGSTAAMRLRMCHAFWV